jgi:adenylate cyclase
LPKVLIIDDERENRDALKRALRDENPQWEIACASSESEARNTLKTEFHKNLGFDLIITDLVMDTECSGMSVLEEAMKVDPFMMAILITAKEKSLDRYKAFDYGAFDVVEKNVLGTTAVKEINIKARAAIRYQAWFKQNNFLRRYFDPRIYETIQKEPNVLRLKNRTVTICFWDIRGFSLLCEVLKAHPELIAEFLKEYSQIAAKAIFHHGGILDKFIGDGVMALFGAFEPEASSNESALHAIHAAIDFRQKFEGMLKKFVPEWSLFAAQDIEIGLGCGIHTGSALVGNVGTEFREQFTALGPNVNLCSRIEARAKPGQILVSQSVSTRVHGKVFLQPEEALSDIKNIPGKFQIFSAG